MEPQARPFPLEDFLAFVREQGLTVGTSEHLTLLRLLQRSVGAPRSTLRAAFAAVLASGPEEQQLVRRLFDTYFPEESAPPASSAEPELHPPPERERKEDTREDTRHKRRLWQGTSALLLVLGLLAVILSLPRGEPERPGTLDAGTPPPAPDAGQPLPAPVQPMPEARYEILGPPPLPPPPVESRDAWRWLWASPAFAVTFLAIFLARRKHTAREHHRLAWRWRLDQLPGPQRYAWNTRGLYSPLSREDLEDFAVLLSRVAREKTGSRQLDVERTVKRSVSRWPFPAISFRQRLSVRPVIFLIDCSREMRLFEGKVAALLAGLERRSVPLECWYFRSSADGGPLRVSWRPRGPEVTLAELRNKRPGWPLVLLSSGSGLTDEAGALAPWAQALSHEGPCTWLHPVPDPALWRPPLRRTDFPMNVWPLTRAGLRGATSDLASDERQRFHRQQPASALPVTVGEVERLKQLVALGSGVPLEVVELLRRRFLTDAPESALLAVIQESAHADGALVTFSPEEETRLIAELRRSAPEQELKARRLLLELLHASEPTRGSAAHLRWQIDRTLAELQLAVTDGLKTSEWVATLRALAAGPVREEVGAAIEKLLAAEAVQGQSWAAVPLPPVLLKELRDIKAAVDRKAVVASESEKGPPSKPGPGSLVPVHVPGPPRMVWPGRSEFVGSGLAFLAVWLGLAGVGLPRPLMHEPVEGYSLSFDEAPTELGRLYVKSLQKDLPERVALYRDGTLISSDIELDSGVNLQPSTDDHIYHVKAQVPGMLMHPLILHQRKPKTS